MVQPGRIAVGIRCHWGSISYCGRLVGAREPAFTSPDVSNQAMLEALGQPEQELQKELDDQRSTSAKTEQELAQVTAERRSLEEDLRIRS